MKSISVYTSDKYLYQKIKLDAPAETEVVLCKKLEGALTLIDIDSGYKPDENALTMSRYGNADISIPFTLGKISELLEGGSALLSLSEKDKCVYLRGEGIRLTDVEYSLLSLLIKHEGEFASRTEILSEVWGGDADAGVINVYIHYLREKLEGQGEKIILSSRKQGYRIDPKYLGGNLCSE